MNLVVGLIGGLGLLALILALFFRQRVLAVKIEDGAANPEELARLKEISSAIAEGAMAFLSREYRVLAIFMALFAVVIFATVQHGLETAVAFLIGAGTSVAAGYIGMRIATVGNVRTASAARVSLQKSFSVAFESGAVMGFGLTGLAVIGLILVWLGIDAFIPGLTAEQQMEILSGFGLGGSAVALFGRVGGGIYTKAADVGADLVGKVEAGIPEDDPRNPAVIADNVGDNVGDIAGMGADLFGSVAESTCAALVIGAVGYQATGGTDLNILLFPMLVNGVGIVASILALPFVRATQEDKVEAALKNALIISTFIMLVALYPITMWAFGSNTFMVGERRWKCNAGSWIGNRNPPGTGMWGQYYTMARAGDATTCGSGSSLAPVPLNAPDGNPALRKARCSQGLNSEHVGGAHFLFADGSVRFIGENISYADGDVCGRVWTGLGLYNRLAIRDDGQPTGEF
jgi:K(+)-stimulated pyrophosphate-energized sodium pump